MAHAITIRIELIYRALIIHIMRFVFLVLMIALLPLRGWTEVAMAMQQTAPELPCHEMVADHGHSVDSVQPDSASASGNPAEHGECDQCNICQICHSVALYPFTSPLPFVALPTPVQSKGLTLFASVPDAPHLKPPIS